MHQKILSPAQYQISKQTPWCSCFVFVAQHSSFDIFSLVQNYKTLLLLGPFNPHVVQLLKTNHHACFGYAAFTSQNYSSKIILRRQYSTVENLLAQKTNVRNPEEEETVVYDRSVFQQDNRAKSSCRKTVHPWLIHIRQMQWFINCTKIQLIFCCLNKDNYYSIKS